MDELQRTLAPGWNTWNTDSLTSHILLPERLEINIGFIDEHNSNYVTDFSGKHKPVYGELLLPPQRMRPRHSLRPEVCPRPTPKLENEVGIQLSPWVIPKQSAQSTIRYDLSRAAVV